MPAFATTGERTKVKQNPTRLRILENDYWQSRTARFLSDYRFNGQTVTSVFGQFSDYDLVLPDGTTAELKRDTNAAHTGNVAIEISRRGPDGEQIPSGLSVTKADWFMFLVPDPKHLVHVYEIETERLKRLTPRLKQIPCNNGRTHCYLLPLDQLRKSEYIGYYPDSFARPAK